MQGILKLFVVALVCGALCVQANAAVVTSQQAQNVADCHVVRAYVAQYGVVRAIRWALSQGYTWAQIKAVRAECK